MLIYLLQLTTSTEIYTLSLHDALPIYHVMAVDYTVEGDRFIPATPHPWRDRKSTRLNSSHRCISYAVFCLKKKKNYVNMAENLQQVSMWFDSYTTLYVNLCAAVLDLGI